MAPFSVVWAAIMPFIIILLRLGSAYGEDFELQILHINDMHARFEQADIEGNMCTEELAKSNACYGGFARLKKAVDDYKTEAKKGGVPSIFLNAGDTFQGTPYYSVFKWKIVADLISTMNFTAMSLGNHEFDDGISDLASYLNSISVPTLAANINITLEPTLLQNSVLLPYIVLHVKNKKVGIIGYITPYTKEMSNTGKVEFTDEIESIQRVARGLKASGVNIVIALGHSGFDKDIEIAKSVPEVSLIVGGHSHSLLYSPVDKPPSIDKIVAEYPYIVTQHQSNPKIPIVQAYCNAKYLGRLKVKFNEQGHVVESSGNTVLLNASFKEDEAVKSSVDKYKQLIRKIISVDVGKTNVYLSKQLTIQQNSVESNFGNMATDAFVDYVARKYTGKTGWTEAAVALLQIGAIRTNINNLKDKGRISYGDLLTAFPFDDYLVKVKINGTTLKNVLEYSVRDVKIVKTNLYTEGGSRFLYSSGIKAVYDLTKPRGNRVESLYIRCANCSAPRYNKFCPRHNAMTSYSILIPSYMFYGDGGFNMFPNEISSYQSINVTLTNVVAQYIRIHEVVYPGHEGRITIENAGSSIIKFPTAFCLSLALLWKFLLISPL